ncbi:hypothetical protein Bca101_030046 [Brassica carinata]
MGNCGSFQISCDEVVNRVIGCLCRKGYIGNLKKNLRDLEREMEDLRASQDVLKTNYKYGRNIFLLLEEVKKLRSEGNFQEVTELTPTYVVVERPTQPTVGQKEMLKQAWNRLMEDGAGIMGLHGMGGIGKTTLFKKIHNRFAGTAEKFDILIWIVVSQGANISKLQEDIARKLHLCGEEWTNKNESDKAAEIHTVLKRQRFVLMLDDIWEKVDLEAIGVPEPTIENGCKVAFTTRYEKLRREPRIDGLARKVAEKCHGLPLALSIIGETMASKTMVQEWEDAIDVLTRNASEFSDMEDKNSSSSEVQLR